MSSNEPSPVIVDIDDDSDLPRRRAPGTVRMLCFSAGSEKYGIPVSALFEVTHRPKATPVPHTPGFVIGVFNLRGRIVTLLDLRHFLGTEKQGIPDSMFAIIVEHEGHRMAFAIDRILETMDIEPGMMQPPLATLAPEQARLIRGQAVAGSEIITILDMTKLVSCDELAQLRQSGADAR